MPLLAVKYLLCTCVSGTGVLAMGLYVYGELGAPAGCEVLELEGDSLHSCVPVLL